MAFRLLLKGVVQGVGFRPFVYNLATEKGVNGTVKNSSEGVEIILFEDYETSQMFLDEVIKKAPKISFVSDWEIREIHSDKSVSGFQIIKSEKNCGVTMVSPDLAICDECRAEFYDPYNGRYLYPFINCTNCGPRYSIIETIPYDRPNTSMKMFKMCPKCLAEYDDVSDRRFHAQPNACPVCGPQVFYKDTMGEDTVKRAADFLNRDGIVGVKGLGGYHIMCDASSSGAVKKLRKFKNRNYKPFAIMVKDEETLKRNGIFLSPSESDIFNSYQAPILIVESGDFKWCSIINPAGTKIGFMKAYTPLHLLIFEHFKGDFLVATSGNLRDEPIVTDTKSAEERLKVCDMFIHHDRDIVNRADDSLVTVVNEKPYILRRGRGYAPFPVIIKNPSGKQIFGAGAHLKNSITLLKYDFAFVSQYVGDLENYESARFYEEVFQRMKGLFDISPEMAVTDLHPDYYSSRYAEKTFKDILRVQHHKAHMLACMAENAIDDNIIGIIFDGTGLGEDKKIWGGEIFSKKGRDIQRELHLEYVPQVGGDYAAKYPMRMFMNYVAFFHLDESLIPEKYLGELEITKKIIKSGRGFVETSSLGRFFEGLGAFLNGVYENEYEGHTAVLLENLCAKDIDDYYLFSIVDSQIRLKSVFEQIVRDYKDGVDRSLIASKIHNTVARFALDSARKIRIATGINRVCFSGGVFQNIYLVKKVSELFKQDGFDLFLHKFLPPNDGCISLGQVNFSLLES